MNIREHAESVVNSHVLWSVGAGFIPIPLADMVAVTAVQLDMLKQLSAVYGHDFSETSGKSWISALTGTYLARLGSQALKAIPGIGSLLGGISMSVLSGASTYAIGRVFINHFESGGDLLNFDPDKFKSFYQEQFEKGKKVAKDMKDKYDKDKSAGKTPETPFSASSASGSKAKGDPISRLKELADMRDKGVISEDDFERMKKKILDEI